MSWWVWLILIVVALGAWQTIKQQIAKGIHDKPEENYVPGATPAVKPKARAKPTVQPPVGPVHWPDDQGVLSAVGTRYYQPALKKIAGDHGNKRADVTVTAHLVPDPDNKHDDKAIRIDIDGETVGHLSSEDARSFRRRLGAKKIGAVTTTCSAKVWGGFDRNNQPRDYGVDLYIKPFV